MVIAVDGVKMNEERGLDANDEGKQTRRMESNLKEWMDTFTHQPQPSPPLSRRSPACQMSRG
jgi:hypothetical protein